jgi:hypothetical protein
MTLVKLSLSQMVWDLQSASEMQSALASETSLVWASVWVRRLAKRLPSQVGLASASVMELA